MHSLPDRPLIVIELSYDDLSLIERILSIPNNVFTAPTVNNLDPEFEGIRALFLGTLHQAPDYDLYKRAAMLPDSHNATGRFQIKLELSSRQLQLIVDVFPKALAAIDNFDDLHTLTGFSEEQAHMLNKKLALLAKS